MRVPGTHAADVARAMHWLRCVHLDYRRPQQANRTRPGVAGMIGKPTMSPSEEAAWVEMAQSGGLRRYLGTDASHRYLIELRRRARAIDRMRQTNAN